MTTFFGRYRKAIIWAIVIAFLVGGVGLITLQQSGIFNRTPTSNGTTQPTSAAVVNGDKVGLDAFQAQVTQLYNQYQSLYSQAGMDPTTIFSGASGAMLQLRLQAGAMSDLIRQTLYNQEAKKRGIRIARDELDQTFQQQYDAFLQSYDITEDDLAAYLQQQGMTLDQYKQEIRGNIEQQMIVAAVNDEIVGTIEPTDDELMTYFEKNIASYDVPAQVQASHILVSDLQTALDLKAQLDEGADFAELANEYTLDTATKGNGGDLGWFGRGEMVPAFEDAAFALSVGEVSNPVETSYGYHIILVTDKQEAHTPSFEEVRDQVTSDYETEIRQERIDSWYTSTHDESDIEVNLPLINAFLIEQEDLDLGISAFEALRTSGNTSDPYLSYYIGQLYETKMSNLNGDLSVLQAIEEPTEEQLQQIEGLKTQIAEVKQKAIDAYLAALEDVDADEDFLNRILDLDPDSTTATFLLGKLLADRGDSMGAEERFNQVLQKDPESISAYLASGDLALRMKNYSLAKSRYESALELRPNDTSIVLKLVTVELAMDEIAEAEALIAGVREADAGNAKIAIAEGDIAYAKLSGAVSERNQLLVSTDRTEEEEARLASLHEEIESLYNTATDRYQKGLNSGGGLDMNIKLGQVYLLVGKLDDAEREFDSVISRSPYRSEAYEGLAEVFLARGDNEAALEQLRTALSRAFDIEQKQRIAEQIVVLDPSDASTRARLAGIYAEQYKWSAAIREYAQLIDENPTMSEAYEGIAEAYTWRTEYDSALDYLRRGIDQIDRIPTKIRLYSQVVTTIQKQVGAGEPLPPEGLDALIEKAKLQLEQGDDAGALTSLQQVQDVDPTYRAGEVAQLTVEAGGEPPAAATEAGPAPQTQSETVDQVTPPETTSQNE